MAKIGIIGGSGLYHLDHLELIEEVFPLTPWGYPSAPIRICHCRISNISVAFLSRHGSGHALNPTEVPYRANIAALKHVGVQIILSFSAVGSLREELKPRQFVLPNQLIDRTKSGTREATFFENGCAGHVSFADPFCKELSDIILRASTNMNPPLEMHVDKCLVVMEGPAFSTRAESHLYRSWGCDIINMSTLPEAKLAREAEIAYQVICMVADFDCWRESEEAVSVESVLTNLQANSDSVQQLLRQLLPLLSVDLKGSGPGGVVTGMNKLALITSPDARSTQQVANLKFLGIL